MRNLTLDAPPTDPLPAQKRNDQGASFFPEQAAGRLSMQVQRAAGLVAENTPESVAQACNLLIHVVEAGLQCKLVADYD